MSVFVKHAATPCAFTSSDSWVILSPIEQSIKRKIESVGTPLKDWGIQINYGIKTGCNEAFIIDEAKRAEILSWCLDANERKRTEQIIRPILRGRDIKRYAYEWAHLYIIATFPAFHLDIEDYPAIKKHLLSFGKERLEQTGKEHIVNGVRVKARKKSNNKWFETQDTIGYWDDFAKPKIIWGEISDKTKFAIDAKGEFMQEATTFLLTGEHLEYLLCYLNSPLSEYLFSKIGTTTGVGTVRWKKFKLEQLFVPKISDDSNFFANHLSRWLKDSDDIELTAINTKIYSLCNLTDEEIAFIEKAINHFC